MMAITHAVIVTASVSSYNHSCSSAAIASCLRLPTPRPRHYKQHHRPNILFSEQLDRGYLSSLLNHTFLSVHDPYHGCGSAVGFRSGGHRCSGGGAIGLLSCFADCFTRQGVQLFGPDPAWAISVSNPKQ